MGASDSANAPMLHEGSCCTYSACNGNVPFAMPIRDRYLFVCTNRRPDDAPRGSCAARGGEELLSALKAEVVAQGLLGDVRVCGTRCLDLCELGAVVLEEPTHKTHAAVTVEDVPRLVQQLREAVRS